MKLKQSLSFCLALILAAGLLGCGKGTAVYVQSVKTLSGMGGIAPGDKFLGLVVSEYVTEINKDSEKTIKELKVKEGDDVKEGQELFSYDTEELQLTLDKQRLELEQLHISIESYQNKITQLEKERKSASADLKLQYTVEIQTTQIDLKEAELNVKTKESEVQKSEDLLENATVVSPVQGRVQAISENGTDNNGNPLPYITIQQVGSYRVKGILGELQRGSLMEGSRVTISSRTGSGETWGGTVTLVDYENPSQGSEYDRYFGMSADEMTASSKYPFYVQLDSTEGLILGQHVYLELETEDEEERGLFISGAFIAYEEDGTPYVWVEEKGRLQKRTVELGGSNDMMGTWEIVNGLTEEDYIAFPDETLCQEGAPTTHSQPVPETAPAAEEEGA